MTRKIIVLFILAIGIVLIWLYNDILVSAKNVNIIVPIKPLVPTKNIDRVALISQNSTHTHIDNASWTVEERTCINGHYMYRSRQAQRNLSLSYTAVNVEKAGKPFHTDPWDDLSKLELEPKNGFIDLNTQNAEDVVFVTGNSANHFQESIGAVDTALKIRPNWTVLYYDLGLSQPQTEQVQSWCKVKYKRFDFSQYPDHVTNLRNYAWKIFIIADVLKTYPAMLWFDASIRFRAEDPSALQEVIEKNVHNGGFTMLHSSFHSLISTTHPTMYDYLPMRLDGEYRERLARINMLGGGLLLIHRTEEVFYDVLWPLYLCALQENCIAPTKLVNCNKKKLLTQRGLYANCHRFDMSAMTILLLNKWHWDPTCFKLPREITGIIRGDKSKRHQLPTCT